MKFTRKELIELWEMGKPAAAVTLPSDKHCALVNQAIEMLDALREIAVEDDAASFCDPRNFAAKARAALGLPTNFVPYESDDLEFNDDIKD